MAAWLGVFVIAQSQTDLFCFDDSHSRVEMQNGATWTTGEPLAVHSFSSSVTVKGFSACLTKFEENK